MLTLLSVPKVDCRVKVIWKRFLKATTILLSSRRYTTVHIYELSNSQQARFVAPTKKSLQRMRKAMDHMLRARGQCIVKAIWSVARIRMLADKFGPLQCSAGTGRPELFNRLFFTILNKSVKRKAFLSDRAVSSTSSSPLLSLQAMSRSWPRILAYFKSLPSEWPRPRLRVEAKRIVPLLNCLNISEWLWITQSLITLVSFFRVTRGYRLVDWCLLIFLLIYERSNTNLFSIQS